MTLARRIFLPVVAILVLIAAANSLRAPTARRIEASAGRAGRQIRPAQIPRAYLAGTGLRLAEPPAPVAPPPAPLPVPPPAPLPAGAGLVDAGGGAPLIFNHPGASLAADVVVSQLPVFDSPGDASPSRTLPSPTGEGFPLILGVKERRDGWVRVQMPIRPNETTGWVKDSDVKVRSVPNHIVVEVAKRRLSAFNGPQLLMETPVGVGTPRTPTPTGSFYVDISLKDPGGSYGSHILSVAGFSNVLKTFGKGIGQIAIHGTNNQGSVGKFSSNGCIRLSNEAVVRLAALAPTGTPVFILP